MKQHIAVIGGGMAGTAAAWKLADLGYRVTIIEQNNRLGGRIHSQPIDGGAIEMGGSFLTKSYRNVFQFLESTHLKDLLYQEHGVSGMVRDGKAQLATLSTILGNSALSWNAKRQAVPLLIELARTWPNLDMQRPWKAAKYDTHPIASTLSGSAAGKELLEYVIEPILDGYFYWTPETTSEAILLIIGKALLRGGRYKMRGGLQQMPGEAAKGCEVLLSHTVRSVRHTENGYTLELEGNNSLSTLKADAVVCATTASVVPKVIPFLNSKQRDFFSSVSYSSTILVAQTYQPEETRSCRAIAFPRAEGSDLAAVTVSQDLSLDNHNLSILKTYASGAAASKFIGQPDEAVIASLTDQLKDIRKDVLRTGAKPISTYVQRWEEALPVFEVGSLKRLSLLARGEIEQQKALVFAGDYIGGPFIEGAFTSGLDAAARLHNQLTKI